MPNDRRANFGSWRGTPGFTRGQVIDGFADVAGEAAVFVACVFADGPVTVGLGEVPNETSPAFVPFFHPDLPVVFVEVTLQQRGLSNVVCRCLAVVCSREKLTAGTFLSCPGIELLATVVLPIAAEAAFFLVILSFLCDHE